MLPWLHVVCALVSLTILPARAAAVGDARALQEPPPRTAADTLIRADALVRGGHLSDARSVLNQVIERFPSTAWAHWGELGLGFLALARGRMDEARPHYEAAAAGGFQDTAGVVLALLDAQDGRTAEARAVLDSLANDPSRQAAVRQAAGLGSAYVRYWAGDYGAAALAFAAVADAHPGSPLTDDALYGLSQAFLRLGDATSAEQVLERIGEMPAQGFDGAHVRSALRTLGLREILRATRERYHGVPLGQADQMLIALLDVNGRALAIRTLAMLARHEGAAAPGMRLAAGARDAAGASPREQSAAQRPPDAPIGEPDPSHPVAPSEGRSQSRHDRRRTGGILVLAILATVVLLIVRTFPTLRRTTSGPDDR